MSSGVKAVSHIQQLIKNGQPIYKMILCDFSMPELDGPQTSMQIHEICKNAGIDCPYIACVTAYQEASFQKLALDAGMRCFYTKPMTHVQMLEIKEQLQL